MKFEFYSTVEQGKLKRNRGLVAEAIQSFEGKTIEITIRKARNKRSNNQNRYLWGCVYPILRQGFKDLGTLMTLEQVHSFMKDYFIQHQPESIIIREVHIPNSDTTVKTIKSTTELTPTEFNEYKNELQHFGVEMLGVDIPDPNEQVSFL
jgi:hypothetical protein